MKAREIMTPDVCTVGPDATVEAIAAMMVDRGISAVPVVDPKAGVIGMVSEGDLLRRRELGTDKRRHGWRRWLTDPDTLARDYARSRAMKARDIMTAPVVSVDSKATAAEIADLLERYDVKRVPVIDHGKLVGIVSRANLVRALARSMHGADRHPDDETIRDAMFQRLRAQPWTGGATIGVEVTKRTVKLTGMAASEDQHQAIRVMAESIPGVAGVVDELSVMPPVSAVS